MFLINDILALLAANLIFSQALGTSTLFVAAGSRKDLVRTTAVITFFTSAGSLGAYFTDKLIPSSAYAYASLIGYTIVISVLYALFLVLVYFSGKKRFETYRKYIHISAFNCAVMGTLFTVSGRLRETGASVSEYLFGGIEAGAGFVVAAFFLVMAYRKLNSENVPESFRGFPSMLVYLGIISMALYALK